MPEKSRRNFLKQATAGAITLGTASSLQSAAANEKITLALIGCGNRGEKFVDRAEFVCDPDRARLAAAARRAGVPASHAVTDLRRILDNPDIDAVFIATPDHWHAPAAILACEAGKHVYVEKPCSHNLRESRLLLDAARRNQVVVQHGTQQRNAPFTRKAMRMLHEGIIGDVLVAKAWNIQRRANIGHLQPSDPPPEVDYDLWVGPAKFLPFQKNRFHYSWHWWYNFGTGDIGNDGTHEIDYARWGLGVESLPSKVVGLGGKYALDDDQQFPDTATCVFEYPGDGQGGHRRQLILEMRLWSTNYPHNCDGGAEFYGTKGKMFFTKRGKIEVLGERNQRVLVESQKPDTLGNIAAHVDDFLDAIRTGRRPHADIEVAHRTVALIHLANIAVHTGQSLDFDPIKEQITNHNLANTMLSRSYREAGHWAIPHGV